MTQKDKELLLKDLCARMLYRPRVYVDENLPRLKLSAATRIWEYIAVDKPCKPYLRPMSSMTEEESAELSNIISEWYDEELFYLTEEPFLEYALQKINYSINPRLFDWLNKKMFDYRGLIPKGLAIEVTEEFNPYKN